MNQIRELIYRLRQGESERRVACDLGLSRNTVSKYRALADQAGYLDARRGLPADSELLAELGPIKPPPRGESTVSPYREVTERLLLEGAEMTAIFARLRDDHHYTGSYSSVRRFVHELQPRRPEVVVRVHTAPGEEAQVDFGAAGRLFDPHRGIERSAHLFVMTLSHSRHQYDELVFDQRIATWIACHRHAFEFFGGIPQRVVLDNLKAAVILSSPDDPVLGEAYRRMAQHYGFLISPNRPYTPQHKGKVESGVHYTKRNFLVGQSFPDIVVANERLHNWIIEVAGTRRHGTTGEAPLAAFKEREKKALLPLPLEPFNLLDVRRVKVHRDCHVTIEGSFYSVPFEHVGQELEAHIGERVIELYRGVELISTHPRAQEKGEWHTRNAHYPPQKAIYLERTPERCRQIAQDIGPATNQVVEDLLAERPLDRLRAVQRLLKLVEEVGQERLEAACGRALHFGDPRYRRIKDILNAGLDQEPLPSILLPFPQSSANKVGSNYTFARGSEEFFQTSDQVREAGR